MIAFIIKSTLSFFIIYSIYMALLANEKMPTFKRFYLLVGISSSIIVSLIEISVNMPMSSIIAPSIVNNSFSFHFIFYAIYILVAITLLVRFVINVFRLKKLQRENNNINFDGFKIVLVNHNSLPYSFLNYVFVNEQEYINGKITKELLLHELAHVKQKHSFDIIFIEILQIIFWFNPIIWLYKKAIQLNHEYLADDAVIKADIQKQDYQHYLINIASRNYSSCLASSFSYSLTKKRLVMLTLSESPIRGFIKLLILIPTIILMLVTIASGQNATPINFMKTKEDNNKMEQNPDTHKHNTVPKPFYNNSSKADYKYA